MPSAFIRSAVFGPMPKNRSIGSCAMNASACSGRITASPSGLCRAEATLARNLLNDTPADAVSPVAALISSLIARAISVADGGPRLGAVTSR